VSLLAYKSNLNWSSSKFKMEQECT